MLRRFTDEELTARLRAGDAAAFDELYRRYAAKLGAYGGRLVGDRTLGEDVAQAALTNAYQALRRGTEPRFVKAWLYRIARNCALELLERRRELLPGETEEQATFDDGNANHATRGELLHAIQALPERQQSVFLLRELKGLRIDDIAAELGLSSNQVEQSLFAARNRLAEFLIFGGRLNCETLEQLDVDALGRHGKRALKAHLRGCAGCRASAPVAFGKVGIGIALLPAQLFGLARGWVTSLIGAGAAPAAKVAAVAAAGAVAASPIAAPKLLQAVESATSSDAALAASSPELAAGPPPWFERSQPLALLVAAATPAAPLAARTAPLALAPSPPAAVPERVQEATPAGEPVADEPPADEALVDEPPVVEAAVEEEVLTEEPQADETPIDAPADEEAATDAPAPEQPVTEEPAADELAAEEPAAEAPAVEETVHEKPLLEEPLP